MILKIEINSQIGDEVAYSLETTGLETRRDTSAVISVDAFLDQLGPALRRLAAQRRRGWDQVRVYYAASCQPIYNITIELPNGDHRAFGVYGFPHRDSLLEDQRTPVDQDLVTLFAYCLPHER